MDLREHRAPSAPVADATWGPTVTGGRRRRRPLRWIAGALVLIVLLVVGGGIALARHTMSRMTRVDVPSLAGGGAPLNLLVVGSDSREGLTEQEQQELTTGGASGNRTDTIFVLTIRGGRAAMLALPRDLYVQRCDGSMGRINAAMQIGGPDCLVTTVQQLSGISIDHYLEVHFLGFRDIVEAVGGVEVCLEAPISDRDAGIDLPAGCQVLTGAQALGYVRVRKIDSDLERIKRQQTFLRALASEVLSPSTVLNPPQLFRAAGEIGGSLTVDDGFGIFDLARLGLGLRAIAKGNSVSHTVPTTGDNVGGAAVLRPVEAEAEALFAQFRDGSVLAQATPATSLARQDVAVTVLNGAGVAGLARRTAEALREIGYRVVEIGDTDVIATSVVRYPPAMEEAARLLASDLPGPPALEPTDSVGGVTLVLGPDAVAFAD